MLSILTWIKSKLSWVAGLGIALVTFLLGRYRKRAEDAEGIILAQKVRDDVEKEVDSLNDRDKLKRMREYIPED